MHTTPRSKQCAQRWNNHNQNATNSRIKHNIEATSILSKSHEQFQSKFYQPGVGNPKKKTQNTCNYLHFFFNFSYFWIFFKLKKTKQKFDPPNLTSTLSSMWESQENKEGFMGTPLIGASTWSVDVLEMAPTSSGYSSKTKSKVKIHTKQLNLKTRKVKVNEN